MENFWSIIRFWIIPLVSVAATALCLYYAVAWYWMLPVWIGAFAAVCEGGPSQAAMMRPGFWVGIHLTVYVLMQLF